MCVRARDLSRVCVGLCLSTRRVALVLPIVLRQVSRADQPGRFFEPSDGHGLNPRHCRAYPNGLSPYGLSFSCPSRTKPASLSLSLLAPNMFQHRATYLVSWQGELLESSPFSTAASSSVASPHPPNFQVPSS